MQSEYKEKQDDAKGKLQSDIQKLGLCLQSLVFLSPRRVQAFLAWSDLHARLRFARSTIPEEQWGTTRSSNSQYKTEMPQSKAAVQSPN